MGSLNQDKNSIARNEEILRINIQELQSLKSNHDQAHRDLMALKNAIKEREVTLAEHDGRLRKLLERKDTLQNAKELDAVTREIEKIQGDVSTLEDEMLSMMDRLSGDEERFAALETSLHDREARNANDEQRVKEEMARLRNAQNAAQDDFDRRLPDLGAPYRSRFQKLLQGREGKALAEVVSEACSVCHCQIPSALAMDAGRSDRVVNCTNCGRFIYRNA